MRVGVRVGVRVTLSFHSLSGCAAGLWGFLLFLRVLTKTDSNEDNTKTEKLTCGG